MQVTETQSEDPVNLGQQRTAQQTAVVAFAARYHSNLPFQDPQPTLLKEFLPGARSLGCNELQLLNHLYHIPDQKWKAAYAPMTSDPPIVPLLGRHAMLDSAMYAPRNFAKEHLLMVYLAFMCLIQTCHARFAGPLRNV